tara:strand:- start:759 stop:1076 length:318 start_codon:yes stop_codon:yes gene_type:complete
MTLAKRSVNIDLMKSNYGIKSQKPIDIIAKKESSRLKRYKNPNKENFLNMLRDLNVYIKEDIIKPKRKEKSKEQIAPQEERIIIKKKLFKHKNPMDKLKEVYNEI